jgi:hypothetical protein
MVHEGSFVVLDSPVGGSQHRTSVLARGERPGQLGGIGVPRQLVEVEPCLLGLARAGRGG